MKRHDSGMPSPATAKLPTLAASCAWLTQQRNAQSFPAGTTASIPRRVLQYWDRLPPEQIQRLLKHNRQLCSDSGIEYVLHDDASARTFLLQHCGAEVIEAYDVAVHPAMKCDVFRLAWLFHAGGHYVDADLALRPAIETMLALPGALLVYQWDARGLTNLCNWLIGGTAGHTGLAGALDATVSNVHRHCHADPQGALKNILGVSGPGIFTRGIVSTLMSQTAPDIHVETVSQANRFTQLGPEFLGQSLAYKSDARHWLQAAALMDPSDESDPPVPADSPLDRTDISQTAAPSELTFRLPAIGLPFMGDLIPRQHLRQFGCRRNGTGHDACVGQIDIVDGGIRSIAVDRQGTGYHQPASVRVLISGDGEGARAKVVAEQGRIAGIQVIAAGQGFTRASVHIVDGPVVVLVGDSISTISPLPSNPDESFWGTLRSAIRRANPRRNITFFNRALGGATHIGLLLPLSQDRADWAFGSNRSWLDFVLDLQPDLVICAFGMNDREKFSFTALHGLANRLKATGRHRPDVVLCTPLLPSRVTSNPALSSEESQNFRDAAAAYLRGFAATRNWGLLDIHRGLRLARDGVDVRLSELHEAPSPQETRPLPWISPTLCSDFHLRISLPPSDTAVWSDGLQLTLGTSGRKTQTVLILDADQGMIRLTVGDRHPERAARTDQFRLTTWMPVPQDAICRIEVFARDTLLGVSLDGISVFEGVISRFAGNFAPELRSLADHPCPVKVELFAGSFVRSTPWLTDQELWGGHDSPIRGNALNHPSSTGVRQVIAPIVFGADWAASGVVQADAQHGRGTSIGIGEVEPKGQLHVTKTPSGGGILPVAVANNLVLEDAQAVGLSMLTNPNGVARWVVGTGQHQMRWVQAFQAGNDTYSEQLAGKVLRQISSDRELMFVPAGVPRYLVKDLPSPEGPPGLVFVADEAGGAVIAFNDGTCWRRMTDREPVRARVGQV